MTAATAPRVIGVVGAGTMGAGIAQVAAQVAGADTLLHDPVEGATEAALGRISDALERGVGRGRWSADDAGAARGRLRAAPSLEDLAACDLVIEAAPERLEVKHDLMRRLAAITPAVLASNTSSIPITTIAAGCPAPERVVGMHFFNPAPAMRLVEVIGGLRTSPGALALARAAGEAMGKRVIDATDTPGFVVNRCNRPFGGEALRIATERLAEPELVDRICRLGGGFRMGPFELMDLVGIDVNLAVSESFATLSYGEPRWRPSPLAARMVAAGLLGRKTGEGWYRYDGGPPHPHRPEDPPAPTVRAERGFGVVQVAGDTMLAAELRGLAAAAGWDVVSPADGASEAPALAIDAGTGPDEAPIQGGHRVLLCAEGPLHALDPAGGAVGFHALPPLGAGGLVELTRSATSSGHTAAAAEGFFSSLGLHTAWVGDAPGLVLGRIVCQLVNEAAFALGEGVGSTADVDDGMVLGLNHPRGPLAWADLIGLDHVLLVLDGLHDHFREDRYRAAPLLRALVDEGRLGTMTGAGFFDHEG